MIDKWRSTPNVLRRRKCFQFALYDDERDMLKSLAHDYGAKLSYVVSAAILALASLSSFDRAIIMDAVSKRRAKREK